MSMSTHVIGFKPPDQKWKKMKAIWDACEAAGIHPPTEVTMFFNGDRPDPAGVVVPLERHHCCKTYGSLGTSGYEVYITDLPKDVTIIRFYNAW